MSFQCARNYDLLRQACPGTGPVLDISGGLGIAGKAFDASRVYVVCDAAPVSYHDDRSPRLVAGYATELPFPDTSFEAVLILDVLEHLHIDHLVRSVREARRVLRPQCRLLMATPSRLSGPWDSRAATGGPSTTVGLHLNELSVGDMIALARQSGMFPVAFAVKEKRTLWLHPPVTIWAAPSELIMAAAPRRLRERLCRPPAILLAEAPKETGAVPTPERLLAE